MTSVTHTEYSPAKRVPEPDSWMTVVETARYTGRHPKTVYLAIRAGQLTAYQRTAQAPWAVHPKDADRWMRGDPPRVDNAAGCNVRRRPKGRAA